MFSRRNRFDGRLSGFKKGTLGQSAFLVDHLLWGLSEGEVKNAALLREPNAVSEDLLNFNP